MRVVCSNAIVSSTPRVQVANLNWWALHLLKAKRHFKGASLSNARSLSTIMRMQSCPLWHRSQKVIPQFCTKLHKSVPWKASGMGPLSNSYVIQPQSLHEKCIIKGCLITVHEAPTLTKMATLHISFENNWFGTGSACDISHFCNPLRSFPNPYPVKPRRKWRTDKETDTKRKNKYKKKVSSQLT